MEEIAPPNLSDDQWRAFKAIEKGEGPFFLTGKAGTGKSHLVKYITKAKPRVAITATTGLAAQLIGGKTLHSFLALHVELGLVFSPKAEKRMRSTDILIVDEASMLDVPLWNHILERMRKSGHAPKLILVGDLLQLPPVKDKPITAHPDWKHTKILFLATQHRQRDMELINVLEDLRRGDLSQRVKDFVAKRTVAKIDNNSIHLFAHRANADALNQEQLANLKTEERTANWEIKQESSKGKASDLSKSTLSPVIKIKIGARVLLTNNDKTDRWVNGSAGIVKDIRRGQVDVELDTGSLVTVEKIEEKIKDADDNVLFTINQYPLHLAWGLTIHKAQGMTLDKVGVDLNVHFSDGQTYVAISRCRTPEGITFTGILTRLHVNQKLVEMYDRWEREAAEQCFLGTEGPKHVSDETETGLDDRILHDMPFYEEDQSEWDPGDGTV